MVRVSVTTLEKFRRYMNEVSAFDTEEALIETIKGIFLGNDKTQIGGAYHKLLEGEYQNIAGEFHTPESKGQFPFIFSVEQALPALEYRRRHGLMTHEVKASKFYNTAYFPIQ